MQLHKLYFNWGCLLLVSVLPTSLHHQLIHCSVLVCTEMNEHLSLE